MELKTKIPPEHKCSRCGFDLREDVGLKEMCRCFKEHPISTSKSGNYIYITDGEYHGGYTE